MIGVVCSELVVVSDLDLWVKVGVVDIAKSELPVELL